jgi:hypothetical protein
MFHGQQILHKNAGVELEVVLRYSLGLITSVTQELNKQVEFAPVSRNLNSTIFAFTSLMALYDDSELRAAALRVLTPSEYSDACRAFQERVLTTISALLPHFVNETTRTHGGQHQHNLARYPQGASYVEVYTVCGFWKEVDESIRDQSTDEIRQWLSCFGQSLFRRLVHTTDVSMSCREVLPVLCRDAPLGGLFDTAFSADVLTILRDTTLTSIVIDVAYALRRFKCTELRTTTETSEHYASLIRSSMEVFGAHWPGHTELQVADAVSTALSALFFLSRFFGVSSNKRGFCVPEELLAKQMDSCALTEKAVLLEISSTCKQRGENIALEAE